MEQVCFRDLIQVVPLLTELSRKGEGCPRSSELDQALKQQEPFVPPEGGGEVGGWSAYADRGYSGVFTLCCTVFCWVFSLLINGRNT